MGTTTEIELFNFFIFNSSYGLNEGEEAKKILYYHPITDNVDVQIKTVGLVEGIIQFTSTFKPSKDVGALHTQKMRQLYYQAEKDFWIVLSLKVPTVSKQKEEGVEYLDNEIQNFVYEAVLKTMYKMYRLFNGTFESKIQNENLGALKTALEHFYKQHLNTLKFTHSDLLSVFSGIQYLPLDKLNFLMVQCFINALENQYPEIEQSAFLYNDHLIWSGLEPNDMKIVYQYLIRTLLPANIETELQGGSMPRNSASPFTAFQHGRFITGPTNLKLAKTIGIVPKVHLYSNGEQDYHLVVYRALSASVCLFVTGSKNLSLGFFKDLDAYISPKLASVISDISEYCSKQVVTPSNIVENGPKFIYFNKLNLAYKSTVHLDNKQSGNITCPKESLKIMADLAKKKNLLGESSEIIVKTMNDYWVVAKNSNMREFYIALQQKHARLSDISEELKKICDNELVGIFFQPS